MACDNPTGEHRPIYQLVCQMRNESNITGKCCDKSMHLKFKSITIVYSDIFKCYRVNSCSQRCQTSDCVGKFTAIIKQLYFNKIYVLPMFRSKLIILQVSNGQTCNNILNSITF